MRKSDSRVIDGIEFVLQQLPGMRGLKLMHRLARAAGPGVLKALSGGNLAAQDVGILGLAMETVLDRFSESDLEALVKELFETGLMVIDGKSTPIMPVLNDQLAGRQGTILKALKFALEVNYGDFLSELLANVKTLASPAASSSKAP